MKVDYPVDAASDLSQNKCNIPSKKCFLNCGPQVLKLERSSPEPGRPAGGNLSMNQTLEGHSGAVLCVTWNAAYSKLTTSDENGLIIVWMMHKGMWFEEMINNRNKSVVRDMKWTSDGQQICIVYEDGAVIVGSVDGNRLWGKELPMTLQNVQWSPDGRRLIFVAADGHCELFDAAGNRMKDVALLQARSLGPGTGRHPAPHDDDDEDDQEDGDAGDAKSDDASDEAVAGMDWYDGAEGYLYEGVPCLAIGLRDGRVQVGRSLEDPAALACRTGLRLQHVKWNSNGTVLALGGVLRAGGGDGKKGACLVKFYSPTLKLLRTLRVTGGMVSSMSWEGGGLRIALAVESFIYFANIRPDYVWGYAPAAHTVAYAYQKPDRAGMSVSFWNVRSQERHVKHVPGLKLMSGTGEVFSLVSQADNTSAEEHSLTLCNAIGSSLHVKRVPLRAPSAVALTQTHVAVAGQCAVYVWQYSQRASSGGALLEGSLGSASGAARRGERIIDLSDAKCPALSLEAFQGERSTDFPNPVASISMTNKCMVVAHEGGEVRIFSLPGLTLRHTLQAPAALSSAGIRLARLNCDSSLVGLVDSTGAMSMLSVDGIEQGEAKGADPSTSLNWWESLEQRDVWDMMWSEEDPQQFAVMEKMRLHVFDGPVSGEPTPCSGYLAQLKDLEVMCLRLDDVMASPEAVDRAWVESVETRQLREAREAIATSGLAGAYAAVASYSPPAPRRLWVMLSDAALEALDLAWAEKAFVRCADYSGIRFVQRLAGLTDRMKQRAEVCAWFGRYDEAEALYREMDRQDLAIDLRQRLGDWARVVQLAKEGAGDDVQLATAWEHIGRHYCDRGQWAKAATYFKQAQNMGMLGECLYRLEQYEDLAHLASSLPPSSSELAQIGRRLTAVGLVKDGALALERGGDPKGAIDAALSVNGWEIAVELAERHGYTQMDGMLAKAASSLLAAPHGSSKLLAVELYRRANRPTDAALTLARLAADCARIRAAPLLAKKLHVLAALEVERHRKMAVRGGAGRNAAGHPDVATAVAATLDTLMAAPDPTAAAEDRRAGKVLDAAWRGAEAYHYFALAQRQLYSGKIVQAMMSAIRCSEFEDIIEPVHIYCLVALTAYHCNYMGVCSRAFVKLETIEWPTEAQADAVQTLAVNIFTKHSPQDPDPLPQQLADCLDEGRPYQACTASGELITGGARAILCKTCRHFALESKLGGIAHCPLCHSSRR